MTEPDLTLLTHRLALLTRRAMGERMATETWAHDIGFRRGWLGVLRVVAHGVVVSQGVVSDRLLIDPSDLVGLVDILERAGLVTRDRDPTDRRRYALNITEAGKMAVLRLDVVAQDAGESVLAPLDPTEREQLSGLLRRIVDHHADVNYDAASPARPPAGS